MAQDIFLQTQIAAQLLTTGHNHAIQPDPYNWCTTYTFITRRY